MLRHTLPDRLVLGSRRFFRHFALEGYQLDASILPAPHTALSTDPQTSSFLRFNKILWQRSQDSIPANEETSRVLRPPVDYDFRCRQSVAGAGVFRRATGSS